MFWMNLIKCAGAMERGGGIGFCTGFASKTDNPCAKAPKAQVSKTLGFLGLVNPLLTIRALL